MRYEQLTGPKTSFSVSNNADCIRYGVNSQVEWSQNWVAERMTRGSRIGILVHHEDGFSFDTYMPVEQPHPFHTVIVGSGSFISPFYSKISQNKIDELPRLAGSYSDICCPALLQAIEESSLKSFFESCAVLLEPGGNLAVCFSVYYPCDTHTKMILSSAGFFEKRNRRVINAIGFGQLESFGPSLPEKVWLFDRNTLSLGDRQWQQIFSNSFFLVQHCRSGLSQNYPTEEIGNLIVSEKTFLAVFGLWLIRK